MDWLNEGEAKMSELLSVKATAKKLQVSPSTIRNWVDKGYLTAVRFPSGVRRIYEAEVERLASQLFEMAPFVVEEEAPAPKHPGETMDSEEWGPAI